MTTAEITKEMLIEELVDDHSFSVRFLMEKGIRCIMCGEPIWGTIEEAAKEKGFSDGEIDDVINELNRLIDIEEEDGTEAVLIEVAKLNQQ